MEQIDFALLPALDALLQESSVTRAASRLGLSKPAVSYLLGRLRDEMGDPLLVRSGRSLVLTPYARELRARVHDLHLEARQLLRSKEPVELAQIARTFTIRATDYVLTLLGAELDCALRERAPGLRLRFVPNARDDASALEEGGAELAVGIYGALPATLRSRLLLTDRHLCVVRKGHPEVGKRMTMKKYLALPHLQIAPRGLVGGYIDDRLQELGVARTVRRAVPYFSTALELVARSDDILTVSGRIAEQRAAALGLQLFPLPFPTSPYALSLLWPPRFDGDRAHQFLRTTLFEVAQRLAGDRHEGSRRSL